MVDNRKDHSRKKKIATTALGISLLVTGTEATSLLAASPAQAASQDIISNSNRQQQIEQIFREINSYRASKGLKPVKLSPTISKIAQQESDRGVADEDISHSGNFAKDSRAGNWLSAGEISAANSREDPSALVEQWKKSPSHEEILSDPNFTTIGVGVTKTDGKLLGGKSWKLVSTVDFYQYAPKDEPKDSYVPSNPPVVDKPQPKPGNNYDPVKNRDYTQNFKSNRNGSINEFYTVNGGSKTFGPKQTNPQISRGGGYVQDLNSFYKVYSHPNGTVQAVNFSTEIGREFHESGSEYLVGYPVSGVQRLSGTDAYYQKFNHPDFKSDSYIVWRPGEPAEIIKDDIAAEWGKNPTAYGVPSGIFRMYGLRYVIQEFDRGGTSIFLSTASESNKVFYLRESSGIGSAWSKSGKADGWGVPTTNEYHDGGFIKQRFSNRIEARWKDGSMSIVRF